MENQVVNNLAIEIANLHIQLAQAKAENEQLKQQLSTKEEEK